MNGFVGQKNEGYFSNVSLGEGAIYIHIPFCKKACHYCDFHFSTSLKKKKLLIESILKEFELKKELFAATSVATIYFGGGTPSLLSQLEIDTIIAEVHKHYNVILNPEITLEANPDDLSKEKIRELANSKVNRLSIGVQSFFEKDLQLMNRAHSAKEAKESLKIATQFFNNISIDLIYGIPEVSNKQWEENIDTALGFGVPHISSYALTIENNTVLQKLVEKGEIKNTNDEITAEQFAILVDKLTKNDFVHYELSNFGKQGFFSKNNSAYWLGKWYLGFGPSAHSFYKNTRTWNISNNSKYIKSIEKNCIPEEVEILSKKDKFNEQIMTGLRTVWGIDLLLISNFFGEEYESFLRKKIIKYLDEDLLVLKNNTIKTTNKGKFLADGIASDLFML